jgi:GMP synthase (glutamine-hydrolysing)
MPVPTVLALQHMSYETPGTIGATLASRGVAVETVPVFDGAPVPRDLGGADALLVMGGPMGVDEADRYPAIRDEIALIERAVGDGRPVLGICLGSQLLAAALGGTVSRGRAKEIGWYPVTLTDAGAEDPLLEGSGRSFVAFHWHGDVFSIPPGAVALASSELTPNQGYRYGRSVYGFQFHPEMDRAILDGMIGDFEDELAEAGVTAASVRAGAAAHLDALGAVCASMTTAWASLFDRSP